MVSNIPANIVAPLLAFDVTSGGAFESENRLILLGHGLAAGTLGNDEIAPCNSILDARVLTGAGSMLESMFQMARRNAPAQEIWIGRLEDIGTAEIRTITVGA